MGGIEITNYIIYWNNGVGSTLVYLTATTSATRLWSTSGTLAAN